MNSFDLILIVILIFISIILLWRTTDSMIKSKKITSFLPFFFAGVLICLILILGVYEIFDKMVWFFIKIFFGILFLWIFINFGGIKHGNY